MSGIRESFMRKFNHVGVVTDEKQPDEIYISETKVWVTKPNDHPYCIEYLRYEPDSPVTGPLRQLPHMAFMVDDLEMSIKGEEILLGPFEAIDGLYVAFIYKDGAVFEFMQFTGGHQVKGFL